MEHPKMTEGMLAEAVAHSVDAGKQVFGEALDGPPADQVSPAHLALHAFFRRYDNGWEDALADACDAMVRFIETDAGEAGNPLETPSQREDAYFSAVFSLWGHLTQGIATWTAENSQEASRALVRQIGKLPDLR